MRLHWIWAGVQAIVKATCKLGSRQAVSWQRKQENRTDSLKKAQTRPWGYKAWHRNTHISTTHTLPACQLFGSHEASLDFLKISLKSPLSSYKRPFLSTFARFRMDSRLSENFFTTFGDAISIQQEYKHHHGWGEKWTRERMEDLETDVRMNLSIYMF